MIDLEEGFATVNCSNCGASFDFSMVDHAGGDEFNCPECGHLIDEDSVTINEDRLRDALLP